MDLYRRIARIRSEEEADDLVDDLKAGDCDFSGLTYLMEHQEQAREGTAFYETNYCRSGETYIARMAVLPATEETNGFFAVGV